MLCLLFFLLHLPLLFLVALLVPNPRLTLLRTYVRNHFGSSADLARSVFACARIYMRMSDGHALSEDAHALSDEGMVVRPGVNGPELANYVFIPKAPPPVHVPPGHVPKAPPPVYVPPVHAPKAPPPVLSHSHGGRSHRPQSQSKPETQLAQLAQQAQQAQQAPGAPGTTGTVEAEGEKEYEDAHSYRRTSGHDDDSKGGDNGKSGKGKSKEARLERQRQEQERDMKRKLPSFMHDCRWGSDITMADVCVSKRDVGDNDPRPMEAIDVHGSSSPPGNRFYQTRLLSGEQVAIETLFSGDRDFRLRGDMMFRRIHSHHVNYVDKVTGKLKYENNLPVRSIGKVVSMLMPDGVSVADMATQVCEAAVDHAVIVVLGDESATVVVPNILSKEGVDLDAMSLPPTPPEPT